MNRRYQEAIRSMQQRLREPGRQSSQYIAATAAATVRQTLTPTQTRVNPEPSPITRVNPEPSPNPGEP